MHRRLTFAARNLALGPMLLALLIAPHPAQAQSSGLPSVHNGTVILMYHRFGEDRYPSTNIRVEQFEGHLQELKKPKYSVLPVPEIIAALREGRPLPEHTVGITIDDAYESIYTVAWPRLKAAGLPFTIFVSTDPVDRDFRGILTWKQLHEMLASGLVTLGNHTASHPHMVDNGKSDNRREIREANRRLAEQTGQAPTLFAYPYGEYGTIVRKLVENEGFAAAFGQQSGAIARDADLMALPRFALNEHYGALDRFRLAVNTLPLPVTDVIPLDTQLTVQENPPLFGFTVEPPVEDLDRLACYVAGQGRLELKRIGKRRFEGRPAKPFSAGRTRINCTVPGPGGRWRWFGVQFYLPES